MRTGQTRRLFQLQPRIAVSFRRGTRFKEWAKGAPRPVNATDGCRAREDTAALHAPARLRKTAAGAHARKRHLRNSMTDATAGRTPPRARPVHTGGGRCSKRAPTGREGLRVPPMGARGAKRGAIKTPTGIKRIFQNFFFFGKEPSGFDSTTKCAETVRHRAEGGTKRPRHVCLLSSRRCLRPNVPRSLSPSPTPPSPASALQPDDGIS